MARLGVKIVNINILNDNVSFWYVAIPEGSVGKKMLQNENSFCSIFFGKLLTNVVKNKVVPALCVTIL